MSENRINIEPEITLHTIQTNKFKTNLFSVFLTLPLERKNVTKNALIGTVLRKGTKNMPTSEKISQALEEMYGASFDCGIEKTGDNQVIKFYLETIDEEYLPQKEAIFERSLEILLEIVFEPYIENGGFKKEYVELEKQKIQQIIEGKIDNKAKYALDRCVEEMYKEKPYSIYKFGYIEDLNEITEQNLYNYYQEMIKKCKIDIFVSGNTANTEIISNCVKKYLPNSNNRYKVTEQKQDLENIQEKEVTEEMDIQQGKLVIGLDANEVSNIENYRYITMIYNAILGGGSNSKLFQNVREKASLAYTANSTYVKMKNIILIRAGIEIENYQKAVNIIKEQLEAIKNCEFSEEDVQNAKNLICSTMDSIEEEQDSEVSFYFGQEIDNKQITIEEYKQKVIDVTKEQILQVADKIKINTIYFLTGKTKQGKGE